MYPQAARPLLPLRRERVQLADQGLGLPDGQSAFALVTPEGLDVGQHVDNLLMAQMVAEGGHTAFVAGNLRYRPSLADYPVQQAVPMVPRVPVAVERRGRQCPVGFLYVPVRLTRAVGSVTCGAIRCEYLLACWNNLPGGGSDGSRDVLGGRRRTPG